MFFCHGLLSSRVDLASGSSREEDVLKLREHVNASQRFAVGENIEMIKVQRQLKEKSNNLVTLERRLFDVTIAYTKILLLSVEFPPL